MWLITVFISYSYTLDMNEWWACWNEKDIGCVTVFTGALYHKDLLHTGIPETTN